MKTIPTKPVEAVIPPQAYGFLTANRIRKIATWTGIYAILIVLALIEIFPLVWMLLTSVKDPREVFSDSLFPSSFHFDNFSRVWTTINVPLHYANSIFVTGMTIIIVVTVATLAGYAFARFSFPGNNTIFYIFLLSMIIPGQVTLIPLFIFVKNLGLLNTLPGLSITYLGGALPFAIFLLRAFFRTLPGELRDAGLIDGCSEFGIFSRIYLPLAMPGLATVIIFQFLGTWNEFMYATTFMSSPDSKTIQSALYNAMGRYSTDWTALCSGLSMAIIPVVLVYLLLQRQFQQGLTAGAIKG